VQLPSGNWFAPPGSNRNGSGRFKGAAELRLVLETVTLNNDSYDVQTSSISRYQKGKGKRTAALIGGGAAWRSSHRRVCAPRSWK
jgi:hypothetical protein